MKSYRSAYIYLHFLVYLIMVFDSETNLNKSFNSESPIFFILLTLILFITFYFFSKACEPPGFAIQSPDNIENLYHCEKCNIYSPVRSAHCNDCGKCILRRDHHCPWTGHCIGRDNHYYFYLFLIGEFFSTFLALIDFIENFFEYLSPFQFFIKKWTFLIILSPIIFGIFMSFTLIVTHTKLILNNLTIWELSRWDKITYLKNFPRNILPFNKGTLNNIKEFYYMNQLKLEWDIPKIPDDYIQDPLSILLTKPKYVL